MKNENTYNFSEFDESDRYKKRTMIQIGRNIKKIRLKRKMSQMTAAEIAGISDNFWGSVERGRQMPSSVVILKIADALRTPLCRLLSMNHCPYVNDNFLVEVEKLFSEKESNERQKALKLLQLLF